MSCVVYWLTSGACYTSFAIGMQHVQLGSSMGTHVSFFDFNTLQWANPRGCICTGSDKIRE